MDWKKAAPFRRKCHVLRNRACLLLVVLLVLTGCVVSGSMTSPAEREQTKSEREKAREIVRELMGCPYQRSPLGEGRNETIYREDVFDCTTFVLTVAVRMNSEPENAAEMMKQVHYYPPGKVSFATRLHFSSYRNKVSRYFEDITSDIGGRRTKREAVVLNRRRAGEGRLIDIDWERKVRVEYIPCSNVPDVVAELPDVVGVGFVRRENFDKGYAITHEGIVLDGRTLVHASLKEGKVVSMDFLDYLNRQKYSGVSFFRMRQVMERNETFHEERN